MVSAQLLTRPRRLLTSHLARYSMSHSDTLLSPQSTSLMSPYSVNSILLFASTAMLTRPEGSSGRGISCNVSECSTLCAFQQCAKGV